MVDSNSPIRDDIGPNVIQAVSPSDVMHRSSPEYYFRLGRQALETIQRSVALWDFAAGLLITQALLSLCLVLFMMIATCAGVVPSRSVRDVD